MMRVLGGVIFDSLKLDVWMYGRMDSLLLTMILIGLT